MRSGLLQVEMCRQDDDVPMDFQLCASPLALALVLACRRLQPALTLLRTGRYADTRFGEAERLLSEGLQAFQQAA